MNHYDQIKQKLEKFIYKYYVNELIKGIILFFAIGALYFLTSVLIENFLWLNKTGRGILFWLFVIVEIGLFCRLIIFPVLKLFKVFKGIDEFNASQIIGKHFPEVNDKLLNILQLKKQHNDAELVLASIEQKSLELQPVPFRLAINFRENIKYLKYAIIPVLIFLVVSIFNSKNWFSSSYERMVNYKVAYEAPAPFHFVILNKSLITEENQNFKLQVKTEGKILPEQVQVHFNGQDYFLKNRGDGSFSYDFIGIDDNITFQLKANDVISKEYTLEITAIPAIEAFEMKLQFPEYLNKKSEILKSTGNATIPEGTLVEWKVKGRNTQIVDFVDRDSVFKFQKDGDEFNYNRTIFEAIPYTLNTSNEHLKNYESLSFNLNVIKDQYPEIKIQSQVDSTNTEIWYFLGQVSDDYGLRALELIYYDINNPDEIQKKKIEIANTNYDEFSYQFPSGLKLIEGNSYEFFFRVYDNDVLHGYKNSKTKTFSYNKLTLEEKEKEQLLQQNNTIDNIDKTLDKLKEQNKTFEEISKTQKEKKNLSFNDKKKLQDFLKRQKQQEQLMQKFGDELKKNLEEFEKNKTDDPYKKALKERLERNEKKLKQNEKLLEELEKIQDKINKEELFDKLEKLGKKNKSSQKNLEQLLELTKRYYVNKKLEKLASELNKLAEEQEQLSKDNNEDNTKEKQDKLNNKFEDYQKELEELKKDNENLKKPIPIEDQKSEEESVKKDQQKASEELEKGDKNAAQKKQKSAADKMKQMGEQMQSMMQSGGEEQEQEDIEMLRQILDNLVEFSKSQETLMKNFKSIEPNHPTYANRLKRQSVLRENFRHVDDSLYALALRNPKISEDVTEKLTDIEFNIDKSLERLSENMISQGTSSQRYTITGANDLAYMLSQALNNMNISMSASSSSGKPNQSRGFQLPDIIKQQESLGEQMKEGLKKSKDGKPKDGEGNKEGEKSNESKEGKQGGKKEGGEKNGDGEGDDFNEELNGQLFEIYKKQQELRNALENKLIENGLNPDEKRILNEMKDVEDELLNKGFNEQTLSRLINLKHQLLKLEEATLKQGEKEERESKNSNVDFENNSNDLKEKIRQYFNATEILNRQTLPLRSNYKIKVQEYFNKKDD